MAHRRWFSFRWFLLGFLVALLLFLVLAPLFSSNTRDARRAEGEQMLGSMKGMVRVAFAKTDGRVPSRLTGPIEGGGSGVEASELQGKYYRILDHVSPRGAKGVALFAIPANRKSPVIVHQFGWSDPDGTMTHQYGGAR